MDPWTLLEGLSITEITASTLLVIMALLWFKGAFVQKSIYDAAVAEKEAWKQVALENKDSLKALGEASEATEKLLQVMTYKMEAAQHTTSSREEVDHDKH